MSQVKKTKGFASMTPERLRTVAALGGRAAHAKGTAHQFNSTTGRIAGMKGGIAKRDKDRLSGGRCHQPQFLTPEQDLAARKRAMKAGSVGQRKAV